MTTTILALILGLTLGTTLTYLWLRGRIALLDSDLIHKREAQAAAEEQASTLRERNEAMQRELTRLVGREAELSTHISLLKAQQAEAEAKNQNLSSELKAQFRVLASELMQEKSEAMLKRNEEALAPLKGLLASVAHSLPHRASSR